MNLHVVEHESALDFLGSCQDWLSKDELINHGVLSLANILTPEHPIYRPPYRFIHVTIDNEIAGCCIHAEPDGLVLSACKNEVTFALFEYLQQTVPRPSRIIGPEKPVICLARLFSDSMQSSFRVHSRWRIHYLNHRSYSGGAVSGNIQLGELDDVELVREWGRSYNEERPANVNITQFLSKKLSDRHLYFWVDGTPKCLATISGMNCSGPRISAVYTPPKFRAHGYATALVNDLSNMYLEQGSEYVTLNTQAGDPVERIYERLGYKQVGEKVSVIFEDK